MASFASGANAFVNSPHNIRTIGPNPTTVRGQGLHINVHPRENKILYPSGKFIVIRSLDTPNDCFIYRGHSVATTVAKFSPNGFWVASGDSSGKVRVWSWDNPEHQTKLETPVFAGAIADLDWDFESKRIVAVGEGSGMMAKVFTWDTGNSLGEMVGHNKRILSVAFKPTRPFRIATSSEDMRTLFYSGPPFKLDHSNNAVHTNFVNSIRYAPDGSKFASVGSDKKIQVYNGTTGLPEGEVVDAHTGSILSVSFSPDSTRFATASADKTVKVWDAATLANVHTFQLSPDPQVGDMQMSVLWTRVGILSVSLNGNINVLDVTSVTPVRVLEAHQVSITAMCLDADSPRMFSASFDGVVCVRNLDSGDVTRVRGEDRRNIAGGAHGGKVVGIAATGGEVVSVGWDDAIRFAGIESGAYYESLALNGQPSALAAAPVAAPGLVVVVTNAEIALFRGHAKVATSTISYTGTCAAMRAEEVAIGGDDNKTHIYSIVGDALAEVASTTTRSAVSALSYSPTGEVLAIGDNGRQVEVYERGTWAPKIQSEWVFHTSKITALAWSPSGGQLASGSLDENIIIWDYTNPSRRIQISFAHMGGVTGLGWRDEDNFISTGNDQVVGVWRIKRE